MEDISSCNTGRERLGIRFTIDYLLYNKDSKSMKEEPKSPQAEQTPHSPVEEQSPDTLSERESIELGSPEKGPEGEEGSEEEDEEKEEVKVEEDQEATTTDSPRDKPTQSYIALISMAILASEEKKLLLCDIYHWIMDNYPYFKSKDKNWRNSVRHNLSLNECFVKAGRSDNGKGHFWAIHPVNFQDFSNGDYHRRRARRRIRRVTGQLPFALHATYYPSTGPGRCRAGAAPNPPSLPGPPSVLPLSQDVLELGQPVCQTTPIPPRSGSIAPHRIGCMFDVGLLFV